MAETADQHRFVFDLDRAILSQVVEQLEQSPPLPLCKGVGPPDSGVYALYLNDRLVYIGKASKGTTKSKRTLRTRLNEHVNKISGRQKISLADLTCRYLTFAGEWWVFAAEFAIIAHYRPEWNESGFAKLRRWIRISGHAIIAIRDSDLNLGKQKEAASLILFSIPSLTAIPVTAHDPEAVSFSRVMGRFPFRRTHWAVAHLDDEVAHGEARFFRPAYEIAMRPFRSMVVDHIGDFGEQQAVWF